MKLFPLINFMVSAFFLTSCSNYPRLLSFPFSDNNRSFNSRSSELNPFIAGEYITFASDRNGSQDVFLFDAKNRRLIDLPNLNSLEEIASNPSISEDGRYLVFTGSTQGKSGLYLYDRTTQQKRPLMTQIRNEIRNPMISSNGERITFEIANNGQWDIVVTDLKGNILNIPGNLLQ
ncbi:Tol biopolymer transporter periplasmic protein [Geminocystis sp. GBBB08]|uniref:TolB family protein n=1 Tax=Geminocystis sp. GBBB08 TaxID=2604140 RepID=UPI0027E34B93|nr:Tol biopolymer transporter periplasmic protein [Geminocystis sp. GBBB08]MBL1210321.1 Tol biopolymer transporter periplasmic protein [Geminocystis sp. GBBB08]